MKTGNNRNHKILLVLLSAISILILSVQAAVPGATAHADGDPPPPTPEAQVLTSSKYLTVHNFTTADGTQLTALSIKGPPKPPAGYDLGQDSVTPLITAAAHSLNVPAYEWVMGCSAVSSAMLAGYYDNNGYPNMYAGPTNGGLMPYVDDSWLSWTDSYGGTYPNNPLIASHAGVDGRSGRGSIDDFWVRYNSYTDDPYITGSWAEHPWSTAVGDFLKTSQSSYDNVDGSTWFVVPPFLSGAKLTCDDIDAHGYADMDGTYGRKLFYEARGYAVTDCFNQYTNNRESGGFSLANYRAQIDAGQPVLLNLEGHSIVGVGYEAGTNKIYIHDTWDKLTHSMVWGGIYAGMKLIAVSVVNLAPTVTAPAVVSPIGATYDTTPTYEWNGIVGATQYRYQVMRGTTAIYTRTIACRYGFPCSSTPTTVLPLGAYKWRVQANIDGVWQPYSDYHSFSVGFRSQFNGNAAGWVKRPGAGWTFTSGGYYGTNGVSNKISSISYSKSFTDFTYQVRMKRSAVDSDGGQAGLVVRGSPTFVPNNDWRTAYEFIYSSLNGNFQVWSRVNAVPALLQDWTPSPSIAANDWNTLKVIAKGESLQFYINDSLVWSGVDSSIHSGQVGIWDGNGGSSAERLDVDWATLDPIDPSTP